MKKLIAVGSFREFTNDPAEQQTRPSITEAISKSPLDNEEKIVAYLRNGICLGARGSYVDDVLDPDSRVPLHAHTYTDGTYCWRLDLAHYVEKYHLRLPSDFLHHMASMNWQPPTKDQVDIHSLET
jgi:hypothetical protein